MTRPNSHIALIYHYDLARALAGEVVDWAAIPVNVDAGREGGDLCRAAADFAKRRDLFAMPAPKISPAVVEQMQEIIYPQSAVPATPTAVEQQAADPDPQPSAGGPGPAVDYQPELYKSESAFDRERLRKRIADLISEDALNLRNPTAETLLRRHWPEGVPTLKHDGHTDAQLQLILACVHRVEAEVGAGWHPDDGPPPHVNTNPRASIEYPTAAAPDEGGRVDPDSIQALHDAHGTLDYEQGALVAQIATEARQAGRNLSVSANPTVRRWSIARAVIAWAASGRTLDELWFAASNLATFEQCRDPSATLGGLISQFTIEQADRLYQAASNA